MGSLVIFLFVQFTRKDWWGKNFQEELFFKTPCITIEHFQNFMK